MICERPDCQHPAKVRFCSRRCALLAVRHLSMAKGGRVCRDRKRKRRALAAVAEVEVHLTEDIREALSPAQLARVKTLIARAHRLGWKKGYQAHNDAVYKQRKLRALKKLEAKASRYQQKGRAA
jgi:hypothetical protein